MCKPAKSIARQSALREIIARPPKMGQLPRGCEREPRVAPRATGMEVLIRSGDVTRVLTGSFVFFLRAFVLIGSESRARRGGLYQPLLFVYSWISNASVIMFTAQCFIFHSCFFLGGFRLRVARELCKGNERDETNVPTLIKAALFIVL